MKTRVTGKWFRKCIHFSKPTVNARLVFRGRNDLPPSISVLKTDKLSRKEDNGHPSVVQNQRNRWQNLPVSLPPVLSCYLFIIVIAIIVVVLAYRQLHTMTDSHHPTVVLKQSFNLIECCQSTLWPHSLCWPHRIYNKTYITYQSSRLSLRLWEFHFPTEPSLE